MDFNSANYAIFRGFALLLLRTMPLGDGLRDNRECCPEMPESELYSSMRFFEIIPRNGGDTLEMHGFGTGMDEEFSPEMEYSNQARP
jgi:hypothetical protein